MDIVFDIETIPNRNMVSRLPAIEIKAGNLKDPAKIAEKEKAAKQEQIEKMALSPLYGRICAWVGAEDENAVWMDCIEAETDAEETRIIESAFELISETRVITYNGTSFDLPFLYRRAVILGIDVREFNMPPLAEMIARYGNKHHIDIMTAWSGYGNFEKLDNLAAVLLDSRKIEIDFRDFPELIKTKEGRDKLLEYCRQDVLLTQKLWNRISGILI